MAQVPLYLLLESGGFLLLESGAQLIIGETELPEIACGVATVSIVTSTAGRVEIVTGAVDSISRVTTATATVTECQ